MVKTKKKKVPYPFQKEDVWQIHRKYKGRCLLASVMGLGKTLQALLYGKIFLDSGPIVVVCPASIKWNWQNEARDVGMRAVVLEHMKPPVDTSHLLHNDEKVIYVINYDILGDRRSTSSWNYWLSELEPKLVIADEIHYARSRTAKRTKYLWQLCQEVDKIITISGTPMVNRPAELWPALNILRPDVNYFATFKRFATRFCRPEWTPWGIKYTGAVRTQELNKLLRDTVMIRRTKEEVLKDLPPKTTDIVLVDIDRADEYRAAEKDFVRWLIRTHPKKAHKSRRSERMTRFGYLKRLAGELKTRAVTEWIDNYLKSSRDKLITFGVHRKVLVPLHERYKQIAVRVDGTVTGHRRQQMVDRFTKNKQCRLFFGNIQAAGVGWNGQVANSVLFAELGWSPGEHAQAIDRAHRIGQKKPVVAYFLIAKGTIEERIIKMITGKQEVLDQIMDGKKTKDSLNLMDRLEAELLKDAKNKGVKHARKTI